MEIRIRTAFILVLMFANFTLFINPAFAHSFKVTLVLPVSIAALPQGRWIREGFMLATTERDSHPDEESDGHLGGLDVYVSMIDEQATAATDIERVAKQGEVDIVAVFGSPKTLSLFKKTLDGKKTALLAPGQSPFSQSDLPAVAGFISAYEKAYGNKPSLHAAQGYNAARRIDMAVRAQGGTDDIALLLRNFKETARGFTW